MDDELQHLEAELTRLRPASPSRALRDRVARSLAREAAQRSTPLVRLMWFAALPAAAALAVALVQFSRRGPAPLPADRNSVAVTPGDAPLKPVAAENVLVSARDEGLVTLDDGTPARRERLQFVDTITWKNPRTNSSLRWSVPREEVRIVPVIFQ